MNTRIRRSLTLVALAAAIVPAGAGAVELVGYGAAWEYLQPGGAADDPNQTDTDFDTTWFARNYNTSNPIDWADASPGPFARGGISAFDPNSSAFIRNAGTVLPDLDTGNRLTTYFRHSFQTTEVTSGFSLDLLVDDGARVYLDGNEILSLNCCVTAGPGQPAAYTDLATTIGNERTYSSYRIMQEQTLAAGNHVLAVGVFNRTERDGDLGFSLRFLEGLVDFVAPQDQWKYFEGYDEPSGGSLDWTTPGFDDGSWDSGQDAFGYEETGAGDPTGVYDMVDAGTLLDMQGAYSSLYIRHPFSVSQLDEIGELTLTVDYDDAFFAYINGQLVFSSEEGNAMIDLSEPIPYDIDGGTVGIDHESTNNSAALPEVFTVRLADFPGLLNEGDDNVLAIQGVNSSLAGSSDFLLGKISLYGSPGSGTPTVPGDFDNDGQLTAADIDLLSGVVRAATNDPFYDVTGDGSVDDADRTEWVEVLRKTYFGDADLDDLFNTADLVTVLSAGEYEDAVAGNSGWAEGDWDGDGDFTTADFVTALAGGGYEQGPRPAVAAVPEPTSLTGWLLIGLLCALRRRR
jgi:hypothetical protein